MASAFRAATPAHRHTHLAKSVYSVVIDLLSDFPFQRTPKFTPALWFSVPAEYRAALVRFTPVSRWSIALVVKLSNFSG